jgi:predicted adenine nucleotide alpha hydrolase (AANH) superfamily ATPase
MRLLFHCCCAPCATACLEELAALGIAPRLFWYNPNIHPWTEYQNRRDSLVRFAASQNLELETAGEYGLRDFIRGVYAEMDNGPASDGAARCDFCYRTRLEKTAACAAANGFDAFSTSLLVSPYQRHEAIRRAGAELAAQYGVSFLYRDFRPRFREGQARARSLGLYMQKYCGCIFSEEERYAQEAKSGAAAPPERYAKKREPALP